MCRHFGPRENVTCSDEAFSPESGQTAKPSERSSEAPKAAVFCVPLAQNSQISGAASQSPCEGFSASDFGQCAQDVKAEGKHPSEKPPLTLTLTEELLRELHFAVYCQVSGLEDSDEADEPEVIEGMERLNEILGMCIDLENVTTPGTTEPAFNVTTAAEVQL